MSEVQSLRYPNKSHRKNVTLPKHSERLAEFFGVMMGDGGINNKWQANITVNAVADAAYADYIVRLIEELFCIKPVLRRRKDKQALVISISSTSVVDFLIANGFPSGNKLKAGLAIPRWVLRNRKYRVACVRGLVDTDGCLYVHTHRVAEKIYKNIGFCFATYSPSLMNQVIGIFEEFSIVPHITRQGRQLYLYSESAVAWYLAIFGSSNERIKSVYKNWKRG